MGSEREVVVIADFSRTPQGEWPRNTKPEIKGWLDGTDPGYISGTGQTYMNAASKIEQAVNALEEHAGKILNIWTGPDAVQARTALELLHASGSELRGKLSLMGQALQTYSGHLSDARTKVNEEQDVPAGVGTESEAEVVKEALENTHAQRTLYDLNQQIKSIYDLTVPHEVSFELPTVTLPEAPAETRDPRYPNGSGTRSPTFGSSGYDGGGSYGGGSGSTGSYGIGDGSGGSGSNSGAGGAGGSGSGGQNAGGPNPGDSDPGGPIGSVPTGPDTGDPATPGPVTGDPGTNPVPGQPQVPGAGDTVPSVIGGDSTTVTDGVNGTDPTRTDMAGYQPPAATSLTTPTLTPPSTSLVPPSAIHTPTPVGSPGLPSVIGSPSAGGGTVTSLVSGAGRGIAGSPTGMPFMPFMGGGAVGDHTDLERSTYLSEDASAWACGHETTDPVIG
ncbi:WXG100 family type VII secretion target [Nonomuraea terrae]|uniref:WXG100 family type VII secretion target n=1 Tax=Nonomuraea terrae TaxID=2530383 RepID=UPI0037AB2CB1